MLTVRTAFSRAWARMASRALDDAPGIAGAPAPGTRASLVDADRKHDSDRFLDQNRLRWLVNPPGCRRCGLQHGERRSLVMVGTGCAVDRPGDAAWPMSVKRRHRRPGTKASGLSPDAETVSVLGGAVRASCAPSRRVHLTFAKRRVGWMRWLMSGITADEPCGRVRSGRRFRWVGPAPKEQPPRKLSGKRTAR